MGKKLLTTDCTLSGYIIMSIVCTLYVYQESALNHMEKSLYFSSEIMTSAKKFALLLHYLHNQC